MLKNPIKNLSTLLSGQLEPKKSIFKTDISRLTSKGENYGSEIFKLDLIIKSDDGEEEILHVVAKLLPELELMRQMFDIQVTFSKEMAFYEVIVPVLHNFQKELGVKNFINCFPKCYATRKNLLDNRDKIDDDAVILFENLKLQGFGNIERTIGFDLETTKLILRDLAEFHGVPLALKLKKPNIFEEKIKFYCSAYEPMVDSEHVQVLRLVIEEDGEIAHLAPKLVAWGSHPRSPINEPFATLIHSDMWTNNTMQKFENGKIVANKLVDFQMYNYGSPAADVFFFLWSSIPQEILEPNLDYFLKYYHEHLKKILKLHGCDTSPFTYEKLLYEMNAVSEFEFPHAFGFHNLIVNSQKGGQNFENFDTEQVFTSIPLKVKQKSWYMVKECNRRGWFK